MSGGVGSYPYGLFVHINNTVYIVNRSSRRIQVWGGSNPIIPASTFGNLSNPHSIFVTFTGDIYVDNGYQHSRVDKWVFNTTMSTLAMNISQQCYGLFVSINNILYCSMMDLHQVVSKSLNDASQIPTIIAGTGCPGDTAYMLHYPRGIFVDTNLNLYVADCYNDRIQLFASGQSIAQTITDLDSFTLKCPSAVALDADKYLFIVDSGHHRVLGSGPNGFRCLVGCFGSASSASGSLSFPQSMAFDGYGNFFVADMGNNRVQKFILLNNFSGKLKTKKDC